MPALASVGGSGSPSFLRICPSPIKTQRLVGLSGNRRWPIADGNDGVYWSLAGCAQNRVHALVRLFEPQGESAVQSWVVEYVTTGRPDQDIQHEGACRVQEITGLVAGAYRRRSRGCCELSAMDGREFNSNRSQLLLQGLRSAIPGLGEERDCGQ